MKFIYTGHCAAGFVKFQRNDEVVVMPEGEAVEVPEWLAQKLAGNDHFIMESGSDATPEAIELDAPSSVEPVRRKPGRPRKAP